MGINIGLTVLVLLLFLYFFRKINKNDQLINQELPKVVQLFDKGNILQVFKMTKQLYELNPDNELIKNYYDKSRKYAKLKLQYFKHLDIIQLIHFQFLESRTLIN